MNNIIKYIRALLYENDCVIIYGFGGFVCNSYPAKYDVEGTIFYPPSKKIMFNKSLLLNDGLLINYISDVEGINYNEATKKLAFFVLDINYHLENNSSIELEGIGTFEKQQGNTLVFSPNENNNFMLQSFGLKNIHLKKMLPPVLPNNYNGYQKKIKLEVNENKTSSFYYFSKIAMAILLFLALFLTPQNSNDNGEIPYKLTSFYHFTDINKTTSPNPHPPIYQLIVGSYTNLQIAHQVKRKFIIRGFPKTKILANQHTHHRISIGTFYDKDTALTKLYALRNTYKDIWLLSQ